MNDDPPPPQDSDSQIKETASQDASEDIQKSDAEAEKAAQMAKFEEALKDSDWGHQPC